MRIRAKQQNKQQFPNLALEDNLRFEGGGVLRSHSECIQGRRRIQLQRKQKRHVQMMCEAKLNLRKFHLKVCYAFCVVKYYMRHDL